jgi:hypothetical protein
MTNLINTQVGYFQINFLKLKQLLKDQKVKIAAPPNPNTDIFAFLVFPLRRPIFLPWNNHKKRHCSPSSP